MGPEQIRAIKLAEKRSEQMPTTPNRRVQLEQALELWQRFHLSRPEHYAMVLQVPCKEAEKLLALAGITFSKD
ncbi:MAG: hypothetical protein JRI33_07690 [Deltaproteobacteria bacterium]|nr:hypothetical protein [Deltaproteobacteria bacterium]